MSNTSVNSEIDEPRCLCRENEYIGGYQVTEYIGQGAYADVYLAKKDDEKVAVKVYRAGVRNCSYFGNEIRMYKLLEGVPGIPEFIDSGAHLFMDDNQVSVHPYLAIKYYPTQLRELIRYCNELYGFGIPIYVAKKIMRGILGVLRDLHARGIMHTDISPSNILLDKSPEQILFGQTDPQVILTDIGSSTKQDNIFTDIVGTIEYLAPEVLLGAEKFTTAMDIWSAYVVFYEMVTGSCLFDVFGKYGVEYGTELQPVKESEDEYWHFKRLLQLMSIVIGRPPLELRKRYKVTPLRRTGIYGLLMANHNIPSGECRAVERFLKRGLVYNSAKRITAGDALADPFLKIYQVRQEARSEMS